MTEIKTKIPAEMEPAAVGGMVTDAKYIIDRVKNKNQTEVNTEVGTEITNIKGGSSKSIANLDSRLGTVEQLAEISIGGGDAQIATGADFTNPDATKRAKVPTVGAIVDGLNDGVYDVSKRNPSGGPNSDGKFTLDYILSNADTLIPTGWRHGGMTISFVQTYDNKYVQFRLMADAWSIDTDDWAIAEEGVYVENPEFVYVKTDAEGKILWSIKTDGTVYFGAGVPQQVVDYINKKIAELSLDEYEDIVAFLSDYLGSDTTLKALIDSKLNAEGLDPEALATVQTVENPEWIEVITDKYGRIVEGIKKNGEKSFPAGIEQLEEYATIENVNNIATTLQNEIDNIDTIHSLNILNSDKIGIVGDSYTESCFAVKNKSYISKLSLFSDYQFTNFSLSGAIYASRVYAIRSGETLYGDIPYKDQKTKYTMLCCYTNDTSYMTIEEYFETLEAAIKVVQGVGSIPIICTEYHTNINSQAVRAGLSDIARRYGLKFWNIAQITDITNRGKIGGFPSFWYGSHAGTRTNAIESDSYEFYLQELPFPKQSLKIFRARKDTYEDINEYIFGNNYDRAKLFTEISVGERTLMDNSYVDRCDEASSVNNDSDYQKLIGNNPVAMKKVDLISAILPYFSKELNKLSFRIENNSESLKVYAKSCLASPYPIPSFYSAFYITFDIEPQNGDVYYCDEDKANYTVKGHVVDGSGMYHLLCTPFIPKRVTIPGILTKVSGVGDDTINYTYREQAVNTDSITADSGYKFVEIEKNEEGLYELSSMIDSIVCVDKVDLLLVSNTEFNITDVEFKYSGKIEKNSLVEKKITFTSNYWISNEELLPASTFGPAGVLDPNYNLTPSLTYEETMGFNPYKVYPLGCSSKVDITDSNVINLSIPANKVKSTQNDLELELWCRYFPEIYSDGTSNQITEDSFDYNQIFIDINEQKAISEKVGTHWKIVRFKLPTVQDTELNIKIYSNSQGVELTYLSLKYNNV